LNQTFIALSTSSSRIPCLFFRTATENKKTYYNKTNRKVERSKERAKQFSW